MKVFLLLFFGLLLQPSWGQDSISKPDSAYLKQASIFYTNAVRMGDSIFFGSNNNPVHFIDPAAARHYYQFASYFNPQENYPKQKIQQADSLLAIEKTNVIFFIAVSDKNANAEYEVFSCIKEGSAANKFYSFPADISYGIENENGTETTPDVYCVTRIDRSYLAANSVCIIQNKKDTMLIQFEAGDSLYSLHPDLGVIKFRKGSYSFQKIFGKANNLNKPVPAKNKTRKPSSKKQKVKTQKPIKQKKKKNNKRRTYNDRTTGNTITERMWHISKNSDIRKTVTRYPTGRKLSKAWSIAGNHRCIEWTFRDHGLLCLRRESCMKHTCN